MMNSGDSAFAVVFLMFVENSLGLKVLSGVEKTLLGDFSRLRFEAAVRA